MNINKIKQQFSPRNLLFSAVILFSVWSLQSCLKSKEIIPKKIIKTECPTVEFLSNWNEIVYSLIQWFEQAKDSISIDMFIRKNDSIWVLIAKSLLKSADKWVQVTINKDRTWIYTEWKQTLLHKEITLKENIVHKSLIWETSKNLYDTLITKRLFLHKNITINNWTTYKNNHCGKAPCHKKYSSIHQYTNDHSKRITIDDNSLIITTGNFSNELLERNDSWIYITWENVVNADKIEWVTIVQNTIDNPATIESFIALIQQAESTIYIEMAYLWDKSVRQALLEKAKNTPSVKISILVPEKSDVQDDLNKKELTVIKKLWLENISIYTLPMTHNKMLNADFQTYIGSANFNWLSTEKMWEFGLIIDWNRHYNTHNKILTKIQKNIWRSNSLQNTNYNIIRAYFERIIQ